MNVIFFEDADWRKRNLRHVFFGFFTSSMFCLTMIHIYFLPD